MSQPLIRARKYESLDAQLEEQELRPLLHLTPRTGWLNDPNGFSWYQGQYHLFYQYYPYDTKWGPIHWGHAVSSDLISWKYLPTALAPDEEYDQDGCFSGSAVTTPDGTHFLMYTGFRIDYNDPYKRGYQTQNIAVGNGIDYMKFQDNPVIDPKNLPEGTDPYNFRDPKVWLSDDGALCSVIACANKKYGTQLLLFESTDSGVHWHQKSVLAENKDRIGIMWECPDFFFLDGKYVIIAGAMDMQEQGNVFHSGNNVFCMTGSYDLKSASFLEEKICTLDHGPDFYAGQTLQTPDGRRILIGWMQNPDTTDKRTVSFSYFGQMSIPRELTVRDGRILQKPVRELETYRKDPIVYQRVHISSETIQLDGVSGRVIDLMIRVQMDNCTDTYQMFRMQFAKNASFYSELVYYPDQERIHISRTHSGIRRAMISERDATVKFVDGLLNIRMILDRFSTEIFINNGETVFSMTLETEMSAKDITFQANGSLFLDVTKYRLD